MAKNQSSISQIMEENRQLKAQLEGAKKSTSSTKESPSSGVSPEVRASLKEKYSKIME